MKEGGKRRANERNTRWGGGSKDLLIFSEVLVGIYNGIAGFKLHYESMANLLPCPLQTSDWGCIQA